MADGIISLATERVNERTLRLIQVTKLRGSDFRSGRHTYRLSSDGITVFPRLADPVRKDDYRLSEDRISTGIAPLDRMLAEGYGPGSSTLVAGPSGAGKTLMGLHFIFSGAANGEPGVIASLQENPSPAGEGRRAASAGRWRTSGWPSCTGLPTTSTSTNGCTSCSTSSRPPAPRAS